MNSKKEMKTEQHAKYCMECGKGLGENAHFCPSCGCPYLYTPTKVIRMALSTPDEMALNLMHPDHKTMAVYVSKDGQHRISATRRTGNKTWLVMDGKVIRTTQIRELIRGINWA